MCSFFNNLRFHGELYMLFIFSKIILIDQSLQIVFSWAYKLKANYENFFHKHQGNVCFFPKHYWHTSKKDSKVFTKRNLVHSNHMVMTMDVTNVRINYF